MTAKVIAPAVLGVSVNAAGAAETKRIIILTNGNSPFWDAARAGLEDAEKKLDLAKAGLQAVVEVNDGTDRGQIDNVKLQLTYCRITAPLSGRLGLCFDRCCFLRLARSLFLWLLWRLLLRLRFLLVGGHQLS